MPGIPRFDIRAAIGATALLQAATLGAQLVVIAALPRVWGSAGLGAWNTWLAIVGVIGIVELGAGAAVASRAVNLSAAGDWGGAGRLLLTSTLLILLLQFMLFAAIFAAQKAGGAMGQLWDSLSVTAAPTSLMLLATLLSASGVCTGATGTILTTDGRYADAIRIVAASRLLEVLALVGLAAWGCDFLTVAAGQLLVKCAVLAWLAIHCRGRARLASMPISLSRSSLLETVRLLGGSSFVSVGAALLRDGLVLMLAVLQGPIAVATFTSLRTLCNGALQGFNVFSQPMTTALAFHSGADEKDLLAESYGNILVLAGIIGLVAAAFILLASGPTLALMTDNALEVTSGAASAMAVYCFASIVHAGTASVLWATTRLKVLAVGTIIGAAVGALLIAAMPQNPIMPALVMTSATLATIMFFAPPAVAIGFGDAKRLRLHVVHATLRVIGRRR